METCVNLLPAITYFIENVDLNLYIQHNQRDVKFNWAGNITPANPKLRA